MFLQLRPTLQWLGMGNYLWNLQRVADCSTTTIWRCIWSVIDAITSASMMSEWLSSPTGNSVEKHTKFFSDKYHLKNILGVVDGTHIRIQRPASEAHEDAYVNRKQFHSLNAQIVCGANFEILHVDVSSVGSSHDARVWDESGVPRLIQESKLSLLGEVPILVDGSCSLHLTQ